MKSELKKRPLKDLAETYRKDLRVNPEYQRGTKWNLPQKQSLIDSLLRGYDLPLFYVHLLERKNKFTGGVETTVWLVDGQQRLAAITDFLHNDFGLPDPEKEAPGTVVPSLQEAPPSWHGKTFEELSPEDQQRLLARELQVVEMYEESPNEVRDLFIRLQAGTPLTAQEKRDAWPGDFTTFVIRHAGKPNHPESNPKPFFRLVARGKSRMLSVDDGEHYIDGLADTRKFFAGLAMTIMVRDRLGEDFVDLKGKTINEFYKENLELPADDPAAARVLRTLDRVASLPGFADLLTKKPMSFQMAFHFALLVDSLNSGDYVPVWRDDIVKAFQHFQEDLVKARHHFKTTGEPLPHYTRFLVPLGGSGSDTADVIRRRHVFFLEQVYPDIRIKPLDGNRVFGALEKELIWSRDGRKCKNPNCGRLLPFSEAHIHHIVEHSAGGPTTLGNAILVCPECHADRKQMQVLAPVFQEHLRNLSTKAQSAATSTAPSTPSQAAANPTLNGPSQSQPHDPPPCHQLDPDAPGSLAHTKILEGRFGDENVSNWRTLIHSAIRTAKKKAIPFETIRAISNVREGQVKDTSFQRVEGTHYWVQGMDADNAWKETLTLAKLAGLEVMVRFHWRDKDGAAHPKEEGVLHWVPPALPL